ncbi:MAG: hypothetical protein HY744_04105 [Deltaproteobacteria bacterium]|nr:hypothetical protein [Deltaproteobacteria bacterium]
MLAETIAPAAPASWPPGELFVAEQTQADVAHDKSGRRVALLAVRTDRKPVIDVLRVPLGSPAARILYDHLGRGSDDTEGRAERQAIAWAIDIGTDAIFVTHDKRAALTALAELGRCRVAHTFDLWMHLHASGRVTDDEYGRLCERTAKRDDGLPGVPWRIKSAAKWVHAGKDIVMAGWADG